MLDALMQVDGHGATQVATSTTSACPASRPAGSRRRQVGAGQPLLEPGEQRGGLHDDDAVDQAVVGPRHPGSDG